MELTFAFDCQVDDYENYVKAGQVVKVSDTWRKHEGFTPVIITDGYTFTDQPITFDPMEIFFMSECFVELR